MGITSSSTIGEYPAKDILAGIAKVHGVPPQILYGVWGIETTYGNDVTTSPTGAKGAFQFEPETAARYNYPYTNEQTIEIWQAQANGAASYLAQLFRETGSWNAAIERYSGGGYGLSEVEAHGEGAGQPIKANHVPLAKSPLEKAGLGSLTGWTEGVQKVLEFLLSRHDWVRVGKVVLGASFALIAADELLSAGGVTAIPKNITKAVAK
jgi:hypothetical protein